MMNFVPLHVKSDYSLGYGAASIPELVARAAACGFTALALTDLENLYGQVHFHARCRAAGIRAITGLELRPGFSGRNEPGQSSGRLVLLAGDASGYSSLCRVVSRGRSGIPIPGSKTGACTDLLTRISGQTQGLFILSEDIMELQTFDRLGFSGLMGVLAEILTYCRSRNIPVMARGSAVSSLVLNLLVGSPIDPLAQGLLFERFLHPGKSSWPDVDLDLPWDRRDEVIEWVYHHYGRGQVAMVAAHHRFQRRSALREGLKAWGARDELINRLLGALPPEEIGVDQVDFLGLAGQINRADLPLAEELASEVPVLSHSILPLVQELIGRPRQTAVHPGGIVIGRSPLEDMLPLEKAAKGVVMTQYDMASIAELGLVKIDLLGNRCLSELQQSLQLSGSSGCLDDIPPDDPTTLGLIDKAATIGCFQLESPAMRSLLARLPIRRQDDLVAALALIRPGAAAGEAKNAFIRRARGEEPCKLPDPVMVDRLKDTCGLMIYEEDIMVLLSRIGGISLAEADELRSAIVSSGANPEILSRLRTPFMRQALRKSGPPKVSPFRAQRAWEAAARFAAYSFNKAHAASYGQLAYWSAYMKAHYPHAFACALLNHHQGLYPMRTWAADLVRQGVRIQPPHVNHSLGPAVLEKEPGSKPMVYRVRAGLKQIKGLASRTLDRLLEARRTGGPFTELADLLKRVRLSRRDRRALVLCGACDGLAPLLPDAYPFIHEKVLQWLQDGKPTGELARLRIQWPDEPTDHAALYQGLVRVRNELRYLEMHLSFHPLALLRTEAGRYGCLPLRTAVQAPSDSEIRLAALVAAMRRVPTRNGLMQFLTLEDETGILEAVVPPKIFKRMGDRILTPGPFLVNGRLRNQDGALHLVVGRIEPFYERREPFGSGKIGREP